MAQQKHYKYRSDQTALNALVELMKINDAYKPCMPYLLEIIDEVYLPMEKEQIKMAHYQGYRNFIDTTEISEQYYNETYKK